MSNNTNHQGHKSFSIQSEKESLITKKEAASRLAISTRT